MLNLFSASTSLRHIERHILACKTAQLADYAKFYTVYQYDREKFKKILKRARALLLPQSPEELQQLQKKIIKRCYILDEDGQPVRLSDQPHIYRYRTLYNIYRAIYKTLGFNEFSEIRLKIKGLRIWRIIYGEEGSRVCFLDYGTEIEGSENLPIKQRILLHIELLRFLRRRKGGNG